MGGERERGEGEGRTGEGRGGEAPRDPLAWGPQCLNPALTFPYWKLLFLSYIFKTAVAQKLRSGFC